MSSKKSPSSAPKAQGKKASTKKTAQKKTGKKAPASSPTKKSGMEDLQNSFTDIAERSQKAIADFTERTLSGNQVSGGQQAASGLPIDPNNVSSAFQDLFNSFAEHPEKLFQAQVNLWQAHMQLWQTTARRMQGETTEPVITPKPRDKRFRHPDWQETRPFRTRVLEAILSILCEKGPAIGR